jgi:transglutaminase-like putative cysteine protease
MKLSISHKTSYRYSEKVPLNPHHLFLIPQQRTYFRILDAEWIVRPEPSGKSQRINAEGNPFFQVWFQNETDILEVDLRFQLETFDFNPYGFIISPHEYPFDKFEYKGSTAEFLKIYQKTEGFPELRNYAKKLMSENMDIVSFLVALLTGIHKEWSHDLRYEPGLLEPMDTFSSRAGSCRDLSWMLMQMLRDIGLATRFVSGYASNPELEEGHELHGWIEVYLPGAGWVGVDPSLGLFTDHHYIPLASSFHPANTLPIAGTYGGTAKSEFSTEVMIQEV